MDIGIIVLSEKVKRAAGSFSDACNKNAVSTDELMSLLNEIHRLCEKIEGKIEQNGMRSNSF